MDSTPSPRALDRGPALLVATIALIVVLAAGAAVGAVHSLAAGPASTGDATLVAAGGTDVAAPSPASTGEAPVAAADAAPPASAAALDTQGAPATTAGRATPRPVPPAAADPGPDPAPAPTAPTAPATPPAPAKLAPGQRLNPTSAQVSAAMAQLHQRIPLFDPTEAQLRTFAEAVCTSFDQGQSLSQVQAAVQQAVSHVQGASLSATDAAFAVAIATELRCPGYLP